MLYHLLLDTQLALRGFASLSGDPADTDYVSYWRPYSPTSGAQEALGSEGAARHARQVRIIASTYAPSWHRAELAEPN